MAGAGRGLAHSASSVGRRRHLLRQSRARATPRTAAEAPEAPLARARARRHEANRAVVPLPRAVVPARVVRRDPHRPGGLGLGVGASPVPVVALPERASRVASSAEASARTVAAAVEAAAATLGLRPDQVEVEVLKQPVPSTFGKIGEAAVVRVTQSTAAAEPIESTVAVGAQPVAAVVGGEAEQSTPTAVDRPASRGSASRRHPEVTDPDAVAADTELAGDFVEGLLDALDVDGDITTWVDVAGGHVDIEGPKLEFLVGMEGEILSALQELTRLAVLRQTQRWVRITVDVNGFKVRRREEIAAIAKGTAERVAASRQDEELEPMTAFERKIVHDVIAEIPGAQSDSIGEEPNRRVMVRPA